MYFISIEYGAWDDHVSKDVFVSADVEEAASIFNTIIERVRTICAEARDRYVYNGERPCNAWLGSSDPLDNIISSVWDDFVVVVFSHMPTGKIANGREVLHTECVQVFPPDHMVDEVPEVVDNDPLTKFEAMALPYERRQFGWRIH